MCGRYALALSNEEVYESLQNQLPRAFQNGNNPRWERPQDFRPSYNVAPRNRMPVVRRNQDHPEEIMLETMQWGLIPHWTKHPPTAQLNTINARSEGLLDSSSGGMWHALKGHKRCIIPAQGYYEWLKKPSSKVAHFARLPQTPSSSSSSDKPPPYPLLFFAGLWDSVKYVEPVESNWKPNPDTTATGSNKREPYPTGNPIPLSTFTILTTTPSKDLSWLHDRMPCILSSWEDISKWLDLGSLENQKGWEEGKGGTGELLRGKMGLLCYPVPPEVGKVGTNSPTFIEPVSERADGIKSFFKKQSPVKAKPLVKSDSPSSSRKLKEEKDTKHDQDDKDDLKIEAEGIETKITPKDEEKGLGDDSNAPNDIIPSSKEDEDVKPESSSPQKRKRSIEIISDEEKKDGDKAQEGRKGGHQTKVQRKDTGNDKNKEQPVITSFFKTPTTTKKDTSEKSTMTTRGTAAAERGRK